MKLIKQPKSLNELALFLILLSCYGYFFPRWQDQNVNSRLDMVIAVVDDGTFVIDKYAANTVDYAKVGEHRYSDKAPGTAFLGIPVYTALRLVLNTPAVDQLTDRLANSESFKATLRESGSGVLKQKVRFALTQVVLTFVLIALPSAFLGVLIYRLLGRFVASNAVRWAVVLGYGLLTPAFAYANSFVGHQLVAVLLFAAFYRLFMYDPTPKTLLIAGALLGYSVITEYPSFLIVAVLMGYALYRVLTSQTSQRDLIPAHFPGRVLHLTWLIAPMAVCAIGLMVYNTAIFGGPLKLGYERSELWMDKHSQGFMSLTLPHAEAAWGISFGIFRGLFVLSPLLLLALPGFWMWLRRGQFRAEAIVCFLATLSMFLFNASTIMWWGGWSIGPRYLIPGLPFMAVAVAFALQCAPRIQTRFLKSVLTRETWFVFACVLFTWSLIATWGITLAEQQFPPDSIPNPYLSYALPNWAAGNIARNLGSLMGLRGISSLLPLILVIVGLGAIAITKNRQIQTGPTEPRDNAAPVWMTER